RLWVMWARLVFAVPFLSRPRYSRDRAHGPRADTTAGAGGHDGGGAVTPSRDSQCLCACAHPPNVVRSLVCGRWFFPDGLVACDEPRYRRRGSPVRLWCKNFVATHQLDVHWCTEFPYTLYPQNCLSPSVCR